MNTAMLYFINEMIINQLNTLTTLKRPMLNRLCNTGEHAAMAITGDRPIIAFSR